MHTGQSLTAMKQVSNSPRPAPPTPAAKSFGGFSCFPHTQSRTPYTPTSTSSLASRDMSHHEDRSPLASAKDAIVQLGSCRHHSTSPNPQSTLSTFSTDSQSTQSCTPSCKFHTVSYGRGHRLPPRLSILSPTGRRDYRMWIRCIISIPT